MSPDTGYIPCEQYRFGVLTNGLDAAIREFVSTTRTVLDRRVNRLGPQGSSNATVSGLQLLSLSSLPPLTLL